VAWLYALTDRPETGHRLVARIAQTFYRDLPDGIIGNEDAGQMSAWYVFATLGFYPLQPASADYVAGIPLVSRARIAVPGRSLLFVTRSGRGDRLSRLTGDGRTIDPAAIPHALLKRGGSFNFTARPAP
jgi:putative alpha-1,2-mannosidase